jgi:hypothetical protein
MDLEAAVVAALDNETTQRVVAAVLASSGFDSVLTQATDRALRGTEMQRLVEHIASSPEVRSALTSQSTTMAEEMVENVRVRAERLDDAAEHAVRGWLRRPRPA